MLGGTQIGGWTGGVSRHLFHQGVLRSAFARQVDDDLVSRRSHDSAAIRLMSLCLYEKWCLVI